MACYCGDCPSHQPTWGKTMSHYTPPPPKVEATKIDYAIRSHPAGVAAAIRSILKEAAQAGATVDWDTATSESTYDPVSMTEQILLKVSAYSKPMTVIGDKQEWVDDE